MLPKKICLVAGWGRYPIYVAQALKREGVEVHCFGILDHASDKELRKICDVYRPMGMCRFGKIIRHMRRHGITDFLTLGKYHKFRLFQSAALWRHSPDWITLRTFANHFIFRKKDCKDDTLMLAIARMFARFGLKLGCPTDFVPELLAKEGVLTQKAPTQTQWQDIRYGLEVAKELGRFDIGQSVLVANGVVIALEAIEGTDECIRRAGKLCSRGNLILIKRAKPQQDMRFDVPTIGMETLKHFTEAGGQVIAVEAEKTILIDEKEMVALADQQGVSIVAVSFEKEAH